jgi:hypothetical protein
MNWAQIVALYLLLFLLLLHVANHGQPRSNYNAWATLFDTLIWMAILERGGFWGDLFKLN